MAALEPKKDTLDVMERAVKEAAKMSSMDTYVGGNTIGPSSSYYRSVRPSPLVSTARTVEMEKELVAAIGVVMKLAPSVDKESTVYEILGDALRRWKENEETS